MKVEGKGHPSKGQIYTSWFWNMWFFKSRYVVLLGIFLIACSIEKNQETTKVAKRSYFQRISIEKFSEFGIACVPIQIEQEYFLAKLDLGFQGAICVTQDLANKLKNKFFLSNREMSGVCGITKLHSIYRIPQIWINGVSVSDCSLTVENEKDYSSQMIQEEAAPILSEEKGSIGWQLFEPLCLFLNFKRGEVICCDSLRTLQDEEGYLRENISVPFSTKRGLIEFIAILDGNFQRCILDTGSTGTVLNEEDTQQRSLKELAFLPEKNIFLALKIGDKEFGKIPINLLPLRFPFFHIDMVLGMDFLQNHQILIDFPNQKLYFSCQNEET